MQKNLDNLIFIIDSLCKEYFICVTSYLVSFDHLWGFDEDCEIFSVERCCCKAVFELHTESNLLQLFYFVLENLNIDNLVVGEVSWLLAWVIIIGHVNYTIEQEDRFGLVEGTCSIYSLPRVKLYHHQPHCLTLFSEKIYLAMDLIPLIAALYEADELPLS